MDRYIQVLKSISAFSILFSFVILQDAKTFENKKDEFGVYFASKIYEERNPSDNSFFMSQDGYMLGLIGSNEYYDNNYFGFKYRLGAGEVDYTSAGTGTMTGIPDYQVEGTAYYGIPFESTNKRITFFGGLGYRYLLNASGLKASSTGHSGYDRESRYMYLPLGINYETAPSAQDSYWEFRGEYLYLLYGQQTSKLSQVSSSYSDVTNDQEDGSGIKLTAKYHFDKKSGIEGYMDYWDIADSKVDVSGNFMEPRNSTAETGIRYFWKF